MSQDAAATAAFEAQLARAARSLVLELVPREAIEAPAVRDRWLPAGTVAAAVAILALLLALVGFATGGGGRGPATPRDALRPSATVAKELLGSGWSCQLAPATTGALLQPTLGIEHPAARTCVAPPTLHPVTAAMVFDEDPAGHVVGVTITSDVLGVPTGTDTGRQQDLLYQLVALPFTDAADAATARTWLRSALPIVPGASPVTAATAVDGLELRLAPAPGHGYVLEIGATSP